MSKCLTVCMFLFALICIVFVSDWNTPSWSARMVDYGVYKFSRGGKVADENVASGLIVSYGKSLLKETDQVEAQIGTNFGFRYVLSGPDVDAQVKIKVQHPAPLTDPGTGKEFATSEWGQSVPTGSVNWNTGWIFEKDWEIVPGKWVMQLFIDDTKLLEKTFFIKDGRKAVSKGESGISEDAR